MIPTLEKHELSILGEILTEEKKRYCLVDLELMKNHFDLRRENLINNNSNRGQ